MSTLAAIESQLFGAIVPLFIPLEVCPKAPPGAQKYADDVMGYVLWGVGIVFFLGLVIAIASLVAGWIVNMPHATKMGIVGIVMVIVAAIAYALDSTAQRLPNPKLFRSSTLRLEAQSTAALEGTYEPLARVLAADSDDVRDPSLREVLNYVIVAETAFGWAEEGRGWGSSSLANLQGMLMRGTPSEREHSGQVRPVQVVIGRREGVPPSEIPIKAARYVPPPPGADLEARLRDLIVWMQADHGDRIDPVVAAAMGHYEFEALHPFHDGNGRLGRLLIVLQLYASGVLTEPTLSVSTWFEARRTEYYDALLGVSAYGDWSSWVEFFAQGLADSAEAARRRMLALAAVQAELKERLQSTPIRTGNARLLVDFAIGQPTFTVGQAARALGIGNAGAKKLIDSLVTHGILAPYDERVYGRRFHAPRVLDILPEQ